MRSVTVFPAIVILFPQLLLAEWIAIPTETLVHESDLIVIGTLHGVVEQRSADRDEGTDCGRGYLHVDDVLWGDAAAGTDLLLTWENMAAMVCPRVEHGGEQGRRSLWLLTRGKPGEVRADHPGRTIELARAAEVRDLLTRRPVCLRTGGRSHDASQRFVVTVLFRNATDRDLRFPGLEYRAGRLFLSSGISLDVQHYDPSKDLRKKLRPIPNAISSSVDLPPIIVRPHEEKAITLLLSRLYDTSAYGTYSVQIPIEGYEPANTVGISFWAQASSTR
ncbi:MAG: hypothetical protein HYX75_12300 [Acidobacteria bacterium]|nr:hypothetical protein [Acidobacteriota bacterium]